MMLVFDKCIDVTSAAADLAGEPIAVKALPPVDGNTVAMLRGSTYVGAASYRKTGSIVKIINIGVTRKYVGIGRRLVQEIILRTGCKEIWCNAAPEAINFYRRLGMETECLMPDHRARMMKLV